MKNLIWSPTRGDPQGSEEVKEVAVHCGPRYILITDWLPRHLPGQACGLCLFSYALPFLGHWPVGQKSLPADWGWQALLLGGRGTRNSSVLSGWVPRRGAALLQPVYPQTFSPCSTLAVQFGAGSEFRVVTTGSRGWQLAEEGSRGSKRKQGRKVKTLQKLRGKSLFFED